MKLRDRFENWMVHGDGSWISVLMLAVTLALGSLVCNAQQSSDQSLQLLVNIVDQTVQKEGEYYKWVYGYTEDGEPWVTYLVGDQSAADLELIADQWNRVFTRLTEWYGEPFIMREQVEGVPEKENGFYALLSRRVVLGDAIIDKLYAYQASLGEVRAMLNVEAGNAGIMLLLVDPRRY